MTLAEQRAIVRERRSRGFPWHHPPHLDAAGEMRIVTGACFEHQQFLNTSARLAWFEDQLLSMLKELGLACAAWCVLPNYYHILLPIPDIKVFGKAIGRLHGRTSFELNRQDRARGRQIWFNYQDRCMRSEAHFFTSVKYIHNNPVKHGYVKK
jgi:putative transposase